MKGTFEYLAKVVLVACVVFMMSVGTGLAQWYDEEIIEEDVPAVTTSEEPAATTTEEPYYTYGVEETTVAVEEPAEPAKTGVSMDFQDAPLGQVLKVLSEQTGLNFVAGAGLQDKRVTLYLQNVNINEALDTILRSIGLTYEQAGPEASNIYIIKESGRAEIETRTKVFRLSFAPAYAVTQKVNDKDERIPGLDEVIKQMVTDKGKVIVDQRTNSLIVDDIPSQLALIEDIINQLDERTPQVMIESEILETSSNLLKDLGFEWGTGTSGRMFQIYGASMNTGFPWGNLLKSGKEANLLSPGPAQFVPPQGLAVADPTLTEPRLGAISFNYLQVALDAIERNGKTKILARPKILTLNNKMAEIKITQQTAIGSVSEVSSGGTITTGTTAAERVETGIILKVTPQINKDNYITMIVEPSVTTTTRSRYFTDYVDPQTRSAKTTVMVKDGDTIVIGGLMATEDVQSIRKVPILGDVPILGLAFRDKEDLKDDRELVVFLTPHIVRDPVPVADVAAAEEVTWEPAPVVPEELKPQPEPTPVAAAAEVEKPAMTKGRDNAMEKALKDLGAEPVVE